MATLQVTNLQNTAATVTNVSLLADGSTTIVLNSTGTARTGGLRYNAGNLEVYTSGGVWVAAGGGSGTVTGVTASLPLVSTGGTAPVLSINAATNATAGSMSAADKAKLDGAATIVSAVTGTLPITVATGTSTPVIAINAATAAAAGSIEIATLAEAAAGTDATRASTPETAVPKDASGMAGAALIPGGNNAARPSPVTGMFRYNNQSGTPVSLEYYDGAAWSAVGGGTAATLAEAAAGTLTTKYSSPQTAVPKDASGMTGAALIPTGTTLQQPATPVGGMLRMNTTLNPDSLEVYDGTAAAWRSLSYATATPTGLTDLTISANGILPGGTYNNVTINPGVTATVNGFTSILAYGNVTINGTLNGVGLGLPGGKTSVSMSGATGVGVAGTAGQGAGAGIYLGAFGGGTSIGGQICSPEYLQGSSGSSGEVYCNNVGGSNQTSQGGRAGSSLLIRCKGTLTVSGTATINMSGTVGFSSGGGDGAAGGGGGSGGLIYLEGETLSVAGTLNSLGGNGSNAASRFAGGGGGGGGYIILSSPSTITDTSTKSVAGGTAGSSVSDPGTGGAGGGFGGAGGASATAGSAGQILTNYFL